MSGGREKIIHGAFQTTRLRREGEGGREVREGEGEGGKGGRQE